FWHPLIADSVRRMAEDGVRRAVAIALAPHFNSASVEGYLRAVREASAELPEAPEFAFVERWGRHPLYVRAEAERVRAALAGLPAPEDVEVIFTAHSVPARVLAI